MTGLLIGAGGDDQCGSEERHHAEIPQEAETAESLKQETCLRVVLNPVRFAEQPGHREPARGEVGAEVRGQARPPRKKKGYGLPSDNHASG